MFRSLANDAADTFVSYARIRIERKSLNSCQIDCNINKERTRSLLLKNECAMFLFFSNISFERKTR